MDDNIHGLFNLSLTVQTLRNVTEYLSLAKTINVTRIVLPSDVMDGIDKLNVDLNNAANTLSEKTNENSVKIRRVFNDVCDASVGSCWVRYVITGWLLVAATFILCGVFMILNNAISDTCMAMGEWVANPHTESALSNVLPCVDLSTTNKTLFQSKQVVTNIANVVNQFIYNAANLNITQGSPGYYYQSGPTIPSLCYPFDSQFLQRQCTDQEVSSANASTVIFFITWVNLSQLIKFLQVSNFECEVSESGFCTIVGRVTPEIYLQIVAALNESYALL
ncbi:hypothetical protein VNO80_16978 [Phaseolus coccineus]|uniref:Uncharacterized protein n=1 Tax=Phaseolus coccineus TaxID=3886 RepID=A0AAN9MUA9_PHACN